MCHPLPGASSLFLKSIDIAGFKSFARPVHLELPSGITALVGPNGSGKSNVVDALRWAIGEQNVRDLRGQRSEDIIHAGPRRSLGLAEVTLTFDTTGRPDLPAEIAVGRRLYRSGDSEYVAQGKRGRLRDLQDMLRGIGIAGADTVVVNQGMADALLTAAPQERRLVLEQAAGLAGYRVRREEARHKLQATTQNIQTIEVILAELEPRLRVLRRQARAVTERDEARKRLDVALLGWYAARWAEARLRAGELSRRCEQEDALRKERTSALRELEDAAEHAYSAEREWRRRLDVVQAAVHSTQRELDGARFRLHAAEQQAASARRGVEEAGARIDDVEKALAGARGRYAEGTEAQRTRQAERDALTSRLDVCRTELQARRQHLAILEDNAARLAGEAGASERRIAAAGSRLTALREALTRDHARRLALSVRLASLADEHTLKVEEQDRLRAALERAGRNAEAAGTQYAEAMAARDRAHARLERSDRVHRHLRARRADVGRRLTAAQRTMETLGSGLEGSLLASVTVPKGWEAALAAAAGAWQREEQITPDAQPDLRDYLTWRESLGDACQSASWADRLVALHSGGLTPLHGALLVADRVTALQVWQGLAGQPAHRVGSPPIRVITRQGEIFAAAGAGTVIPTDTQTRYLVARREAAALAARAERLDAWLEQRAAATQEQRAAATRWEAELSTQAEGRRAAQLHLAAAEQAVMTAERASAALIRERDELDQEQSRLGERMTAAEREEQTLVAEQEVVLSRHAGTEEELRLAREAFEEVRAAGESAEREAVDLERRHVLLEAQVAADSRSLAGLAEHVERLDRERAALQRAWADHSIGHQNAASAGAEERAKMEELTRVLDEQQRDLSAVRAEQPEIEIDRAGLDAARGRLAEQVRQHERALAQLAQGEEERDRLRIEILRELRQAPELLPAAPDIVPAEDEIRRLRMRANQYPDADETVVEECRELEARYDRLRTQVEDLNDAARELDGIIALADREMQSRFDEAFAALNQEFGRVFQVMLRGGEAALVHEESGGIAVRAQLPGKRARSSASFSGGEKALVASSLLFGILRLRPTPFVVLDEVDAALDESNVDRYVAALRDISTRTQVIIVTHNRATMEAADVLYGVTMDDEGVSRLLSLRLDAYAAAG